ncbi:hypothetical protein GCM10014719_26830 [Planomonospora parontospora subsp. antibiotica]|nr:hypothetical protein GCM10014719_26830 [Planomonospora parontospora subsp. antibiotica]GII15046.1 hypothetical protein Ppa05_17720 [Planomonospora parontospora subsp. antibiotica]
MGPASGPPESQVSPRGLPVRDRASPPVLARIRHAARGPYVKSDDPGAVEKLSSALGYTPGVDFVLPVRPDVL